MFSRYSAEFIVQTMTMGKLGWMLVAVVVALVARALTTRADAQEFPNINPLRQSSTRSLPKSTLDVEIWKSKFNESVPFLMEVPHSKFPQPTCLTDVDGHGAWECYFDDPNTISLLSSVSTVNKIVLRGAAHQYSYTLHCLKFV